MIRIEALRRKVGKWDLEIGELEIGTGEVFALIGPTGAGKTRLIQTLAGFSPAEEGRVIIDGRDVSLEPPERRRLSVVFQTPQLFPHLNVAENIRFGSKDPARFRRTVELLGLAPHLTKPVSALSGGEAQLVALGRALMVEPKALLLDEPFSAIDPAQRRRVIDAFRLVQQQLAMTTLLVTHNFEESLTLGHRLGILLRGKLVQTGSPAEVFARPDTPEIAAFLGAANLLRGVLRHSTKDPGQGQGKFPTVFRSGPVEIHLLADREGEGYVLIHPEDIIISREKPSASSALNQLQGQVERMDRIGPLVEIVVEVGVKLRAVLTPQSCRELRLAEGCNVVLSFKAAAVQFF